MRQALFLIAVACGVGLVSAAPPIRFSLAVAAAAPTSAPHATPVLTVDRGNPSDMTLLRAPSITAGDIETVLARYGSPAMGQGPVFYDLGVRYGIDPAYALAFFIHESSAGTDPNWAGLKPGGQTTHNIGNIICTDTTACYGRFRDYASWAAGIEDWYHLMTTEYIPRGLTTVEAVVPVYAPAFENDVGGYTNAVSATVAAWRTSGV